MAEFILKSMVEERGLREAFTIESAATSTEEIWNGRGNPVYPPARECLLRHGIGQTAYTDFSSKRARQVVREDYDRFDWILCADRSNLRNTLGMLGGDPEGKVKLLLDFSKKPERHGQSIADPWYTGEFETTFRDVVEGCEGFLQACEEGSR